MKKVAVVVVTVWDDTELGGLGLVSREERWAEGPRGPCDCRTVVPPGTRHSKTVLPTREARMKHGYLGYAPGYVLGWKPPGGSRHITECGAYVTRWEEA